MRIITIVLIFLISGCVTPNKVSTSMMKPSLQHRGFSVPRPADSNWYLLANKQKPTKAIFRIDSASNTHSVYTSIQLHKISKQPTTADEFKKIVDDNFLNRMDAQKYTLVSYESTKSIKQGQWSIEYNLIFKGQSSMKSNQSLLTSIKGYIVLHPAWPKTVVEASYSERALETEMINKYEETGKGLIQSVIIESSPGVPVTG